MSAPGGEAGARAHAPAHPLDARGADDAPDAVVADCFVSVVAPLHDDGAIVESFLTEVTDTLVRRYENYEVVLIDDGSRDATVEVVTRLLHRLDCIRLVRLSRSYGEEVAIAAGLDTVIGDVVVVLSPNTDPPRQIPAVVSLVRQGHEMVFGVRRRPRPSGWLRRFGSALFYAYCRTFLGLDFPRNVTQFCGFSRKAVNALNEIKDRHRYLRFSSRYVGFRSAGYEYDTINRARRSETASFLEAASTALDVMISSSKHPFRIVTWFGIAASVLNVFYVGYVVAVYLFRDDVVEGWTTLSLQQAGMFFFLFMILAIQAEYIGQVLDESKDRPRYYILEEQTSSVMLAHEERRNVVRESTTGTLQGAEPGQDPGRPPGP